MEDHVDSSADIPSRARGGRARMQKLTPEERKELASNAAKKRWSKNRISVKMSAAETPVAIAWGSLQVGDTSLPCYVLDNGERGCSVLKGQWWD